MNRPGSYSEFVAEMKLEIRSSKKLRIPDGLWRNTYRKGEKNISAYSDTTMQSSKYTIKHPPSDHSDL